MKPETQELLPCPFCGGKPRVVCYPAGSQSTQYSYFTDRFAVQCEYTGAEQGCGAESQHNKIRELAIDVWNTRANTIPREVAEKMFEALKEADIALNSVNPYRKITDSSSDILTRALKLAQQYDLRKK